MGRRAKYLVAELSSGEALIMHLGMTGRFTVPGKKPGKFHHEAGEAENTSCRLRHAGRGDRHF